MNMSRCKNNKCNLSTPKTKNGKGDSPRNNFSKKFKENFDSINWKKKKIKTTST